MERGWHGPDTVSTSDMTTSASSTFLCSLAASFFNFSSLVMILHELGWDRWGVGGRSKGEKRIKREIGMGRERVEGERGEGERERGGRRKVEDGGRQKRRVGREREGREEKRGREDREGG